MANGDSFTVTDTFKHRYQHPQVLKDCLVSLGYDEDQIKIRAMKGVGLQVQLPDNKALDDNGRRKVMNAFLEAREEARKEAREGAEQ